MSMALLWTLLFVYLLLLAAILALVYAEGERQQQLGEK